MRRDLGLGKRICVRRERSRSIAAGPASFSSQRRQNTAGVALSVLIAACTSVPGGRAAVTSVEVRGSDRVSAGDIEDKLATRESPEFLGLIPEFIYDPEVFDPYVLERDLERVERYYEDQGFYGALVRAGTVTHLDDTHVKVVIEVQEGFPTRIRELELLGLEDLPDDVAEEARSALALHLTRGAIFQQERYRRAKEAIERALLDRGYAYAKVRESARVDLRRFSADVRFDVTPGEVAEIGAVTIHGLGNIPEAPVRRALDLEPGVPYSLTELENAEQAALELGVFSSVDVRPRVEDPPPTPAVMPIDVVTTPSELRTLRLGAGLQFDTLQTAAYLVAGWEHGNFLGGLRRLSLELRPGVIFYPTRLDNLTAPEEYLPEIGALATLRQPGFLEARTIGALRAEYGIYAVLNALGPAGSVLGYREARISAGLERQFGRRLRLQPSQNLQTNSSFAYVGELDQDLGSLVLTWTELLMTLDFRDHFISPREGLRLLLPVQFAGPFGDATDIRIKPDLGVFLPIASRWTLALRTSLGALFPFDYDRPETSARDAQIVFFRGFFAGGPASNRGYAQRGIGPRGVLPFLYLDDSDPCVARDGSSRDACDVALGGISIWEASVEVRYSMRGPLDLALFCDAADVSRRQLHYAFDRPHLACGPGIRYATPVGPIRADLGVRVPGLQVPSGEPAEPAPELFGLPVALAIGIGEAF